MWHSLGNLLAKDRERWSRAEEAYRSSLELLRDPRDQAQVWHSLGNLLAKDGRSWSDVEEAYQTSLTLRHDPHHQGQVLASWADAADKMRTPRGDQIAEKKAKAALRTDPDNPYTAGVCWRVLSWVYEHRRDYAQAADAVEALIGANRRADVHGHEAHNTSRLARLRERAERAAS